MKAIIKGKEPGSLTKYRSNPGATYDGGNFTQTKSAIRKSLLKEQGYLCAYCMKRVVDNELTTKVEHWQCQASHPQRQLDYKNMLAVCSGKTVISTNPPKSKTHCDTFKGHDDIKFNPSEATHHSQMKIYYGVDGHVFSKNSEFQEDIDKKLNLNLTRLKGNRKAVVDSVFSYLSGYQGSCTEGSVRDKLKKWENLDSKGHLTEFCDVAVYFLNKKLKQISK